MTNPSCAFLVGLRCLASPFREHYYWCYRGTPLSVFNYETRGDYRRVLRAVPRHDASSNAGQAVSRTLHFMAVFMLGLYRGTSQLLFNVIIRCECRDSELRDNAMDRTTSGSPIFILCQYPANTQNRWERLGKRLPLARSVAGVVIGFGEKIMLPGTHGTIYP